MTKGKDKKDRFEAVFCFNKRKLNYKFLKLKFAKKKKIKETMSLILIHFSKLS